ncbi:AraC family transcriptional regulator [Mediterraneibacter sp. gm002]|nr:AraC family transcriptional regulator [Ruminococcus sp. B05]TAP31510.1 AraC family transcriptional regulator [Mediterraneibacter sp. gm002]
MSALNNRCCNSTIGSEISRSIILLRNRIGRTECSQFTGIFNVCVQWNYYSLILKKYRGKSFQQYLIEVRMKYAKQLLEQTTLPVKQIAQQVGYENVSHFYHLFEKYYGKTPKEVRAAGDGK